MKELEKKLEEIRMYSEATFTNLESISLKLDKVYKIVHLERQPILGLLELYNKHMRKVYKQK